MNDRDSRRWKRLRKRDVGAAEELLKKDETFYVGASGRFLTRTSRLDHVWALRDRRETLSALLIHSKRTLFPAFRRDTQIPLPRFLRRLCGIHAVQGLKKEVELLENGFARLSHDPRERIEYTLMALDRGPEPASFGGGPEGLVLRRPCAADMDDLFALQSGYEQEEVIPAGGVFNPAVCRYNLERIIAKDRILAAELGGRLVGKINISAVSFTRFLVGGVYVHPACRGRGIARRMTAEFAESLLAEGRGISLFVKKRNRAALSVYRRVGFTEVEDYRISYY